MAQLVTEQGGLAGVTGFALVGKSLQKQGLESSWALNHDL